MKRILVWICMVLMLAVSSAALAAEVTVRGNASVSAQPDLVNVSAGCSVTSENLKEAQEAIGDVISGVRADLEALGIEPDDMVSTGYNYYAAYDYSVDPPRQTGYTASHNVRIVCRDVELLDAVVTVLTDHGVSSIWDIQHSIGNTDELYRQALALAYAQAEENARVLAKAAGFQSIEIKAVSESGADTDIYTARSVKAAAAEDAAAGIRTGFNSGEISVSAGVTAVFEMK